MVVGRGDGRGERSRRGREGEHVRGGKRQPPRVGRTIPRAGGIQAVESDPRGGFACPSPRARFPSAAAAAADQTVLEREREMVVGEGRGVTEMEGGVQ